MTLEQLPRTHLKNELILERRRLRKFNTYEYLSNEMNISLGKVYVFPTAIAKIHIQVEWAKGTTKNAGWSQPRVTMKENYHGCNEVEWARCRIDFSIAIPQNLYILGWEAYQYVSVYFVQVDQFVVKPIGAREILRQLCLKLNFVWLWSGDLSIFSHITSYLGC